MSEPLPVLIVGAGPVGLASALELARFRVPSIVIEQRFTTSWHPKTRNINTRTMEVARGWGGPVYERLRGIDTPDGWKSPIRFLRSIVGEELGQIETRGFLGPGPEVSPALPVMSSQELFEQILLEAARATGLVDLRFGCTMVRVVRGSEPGAKDAVIEVTTGAAGELQTLTGSALVAADGADSLVREQLAVPLEGPRDVGRFINCYFRADVERYVGDRTGVLHFIANENAAGVLQGLDARGRWLCQIAVRGDDWDTELYGPERCRAWIRAAVGAEDIDPEILSVGKWRMNASVAETLVSGRTLLVGDAAHQFPPTGGLGVNTGIQGMHNAMWKLACVIQGIASQALLDTYNSERRPVARWIADQSLDNHWKVAQIAGAALRGPGGAGASDTVSASRRYGNHLGVEFGAAYNSAAVIPDGTSPPEPDDPYTDYEPCARPGHRAPHVALGRYGDVSTVDLVAGPGFTVLAGPARQTWNEAASAAARSSSVSIASYVVGSPSLEDRNASFCDLFGVEEDGAVLVRPDGYVALRLARCPEWPHAVLGDALRQILWGDSTR
jgi:2-polyprenyl-6-methoxyphenol hydroxylase-like FAD-dependent oxidoreductase